MKKYLFIITIVVIILLVTIYVFKTNRVKNEFENEGEKTYMVYKYDYMLGLDNLDLYYEVHLVNLDGECFIYSIYLNDEITNEKIEEIKKSVEDFSNNFNYNGDTYPGYIDIKQKEDIVTIFLDLGGVLPQNENISIQGILNTLNNVEGIKKVMINEL